VLKVLSGGATHSDAVALAQPLTELSQTLGAFVRSAGYAKGAEG